MHAEEQQLASLDRQIRLNSHGVGAAAATGTVILHLHISKSPCSDHCQKEIAKYLEKYPGLQIQMYLEIPYMANKPEEMILEAKELKALMERAPGRLAYQVVNPALVGSRLKKFSNSSSTCRSALVSLPLTDAAPPRDLG